MDRRPLSQEERETLASLLFPGLTLTEEALEKQFPPRDLPEGAVVSRMAPSPTGFVHLGNLVQGLTSERLCHQSGGVLFLRVEDTDAKREVPGAIETLIDSLDHYGIRFDEGATHTGDSGNYGPYRQRQRKEIYHVYAKKLLLAGMAYPCFCTEEELTAIHEEQEKEKSNFGYFGKWAKWRDMPFDAIRQELDRGTPWVLRFRSTGSVENKIKFTDLIKGELELTENDVDHVLLKSDGIPTYHFAHAVDDHLMRTTHVVRGEEWLPSLPIHVELFEDLGWELPIYCHTAQLMKIGEDGNKRKLSKRKDPELSLDFYRNEGYHPAAVREYLLTILNSNYEEWRMENPDADINDFEFTTEKMSSSGALFDLDKLNDVSKNTLLHIDAAELAAWLKSWSDEFAPEYAYVFKDMDHLAEILDLGRHDARPRADLVYARQIMDFISYFFDESFKIEDEYPAEASADAAEILKAYLASYDHSDDNEQWFGKIRDIATDLGYAAKPKDYKKNPDDYKGHVGHVSTVIRIAIMGRSQSPDVWAIQQILGESKVRERLEAACK